MFLFFWVTKLTWRLYIRDFTQTQTIKSAVSLSLLDGIGAGIVINGDLYTGNQGEAGEIGHALYYGLEKPVPIEDLCSDLAVMKQLEKISGKEIDIVDLRQGF
jgi:Transcriptional regulator/sugar kinase